MSIPCHACFLPASALMMKHSLPLLAACLLVCACSPLEPEPIDTGEVPDDSQIVDQWQPDPHDTRTVLDRLALQDINADLVAGSGVTAMTTFGTDEPTENFTYINPVRGLSVTLPYNPNWGSISYALPPYYLYDEVSELRFGPLEIGEGGGYGRRYTLAFRPVRDAQTVAREAEAQIRSVIINREIPAEYLPEITQAGEVTIVHWITDGLCITPMIEVIGEKFNYTLSSCPVDDESRERDLQIMHDVAASVQLID